MHLVEMLVVIAVLAVLLAAGWPRCIRCCCGIAPTPCNWPCGQSGQRAQRGLKRRELIGLCASDDGEQCPRLERGWIIYRSGRHGGHRHPPRTS
jgi:type IV fimbrial biogenesis protein FimT